MVVQLCGKATPVCYLTAFRNLIDLKGAQDAEQNLFGQIAYGLVRQTT